MQIYGIPFPPGKDEKLGMKKTENTKLKPKYEIVSKMFSYRLTILDLYLTIFTEYIILIEKSQSFDLNYFHNIDLPSASNYLAANVWKSHFHPEKTKNEMKIVTYYLIYLSKLRVTCY